MLSPVTSTFGTTTARLLSLSAFARRCTAHYREVAVNVSLPIIEIGRRHPHRPALRLDDTVISYGDLDEITGRLAQLIVNRGLLPGDRIGLMLPNVPEWPLVYYAILRAGAVVVPMNPLLTPREVQYYLQDSSASLLFYWHEVALEAQVGAAAASADVVAVERAGLPTAVAEYAPLPEPIACGDSDTAVILYTSGTTGKPKGAELTHANLAANMSVTARTLLDVGPDDVVMGCLPLFHVFGMTCGLNAALSSGATLTLLPRFDPHKAIEIIARDKVTIFEGVPTMYTAMLNLADSSTADVSSLRLCISGGAAMPVEVMHGFEKAFGCILLEGYGLSETSPVASFNHPGKERKPGSIGTPVQGVQMRVVDDNMNDVTPGDVGEIAISGHNVMKGYWSRPEATAAAIKDSWFLTGDLARVDDDGYFYIVDRKKDLIIRGGYNVYPREIEEVLYEHPAVLEAAVIGIPHNSLGEEVGAAVVLRGGAALTSADLTMFLKQRLAAYKYPRSIWFADALPKGPTGKILRREVKPPATEGGQG